MGQQIRIAAQLYEARDTAKFMLGDNYHAKLEPWIGMIKASAKSRGVSESNIENEPGYYTPPQPRWLNRMIIALGVLTLLLIGTIGMIGAAVLLVMNS